MLEKYISDLKCTIWISCIFKYTLVYFELCCYFHLGRWFWPNGTEKEVDTPRMSRETETQRQTEIERRWEGLREGRKKEEECGDSTLSLAFKVSIFLSSLAFEALRSPVPAKVRAMIYWSLMEVLSVGLSVVPYVWTPANITGFNLSQHTRTGLGSMPFQLKIMTCHEAGNFP